MATLWKVSDRNGKWGLVVTKFRSQAPAAYQRLLGQKSGPGIAPPPVDIRRAAQSDIDEARSLGLPVPDGGWVKLGPLARAAGKHIKLTEPQRRFLLMSEGPRVPLRTKAIKKVAHQLEHAELGIVVNSEFLMNHIGDAIRKRVKDAENQHAG